MMTMNSLFSRRNWSAEGEETHVLAVDDSIVDRKVIEKLLKIYSCKVTAVDSGKRALQYLGLDDEEVTENSRSVVEGLKVDLIITDYCMPGLTGYDLLKKIKESSAFRETPVVIMSSENVLARIDRCLEEGAEDFIVKPVKLSDMERLKEHFTAKDVSRNNKRKQPDGPDIAMSPSSSETSPESSPSCGSLVSSPSLSPPLPPSSPDSSSPESETLDSPSRRLKSC